jgi:uncharacterized protein
MADFMEDDWQIQEFVFSRISYDQNKNYSNWQKHGITFEEATRIFDKPVIARCQIIAHEERWLAVGISGNKFTAVVFCDQGEVIRIVSERAATASERRRHGQHFIQGPS